VEPTGEQRLVTLLDTPAGERWTASTADPALVGAATNRELVGTTVVVDGLAIVGEG
jgi:hypothetical protein